MIPKTKMFGGKRYAIAGAGKSQVSRGRKTLDDWADFQRRVNNNLVRVVKVDGGYAAYMRKGSGKPKSRRC